MEGRLIEIIRGSAIYRALSKLVEWSSESRIAALLNDERVLVGLLGAGLVASLVRILSSGLHVAVQFLSFALLFVVLAAVTWNYTEPLADE